ncbi:MAG: DUF2442 domain-containing protein [Phycisphaeraceae bacterium]
MNTSTAEKSCLAQRVVVTDEAVSVDLSDGRTIIVPIGWYPRLLQGTPAERNRVEFNGGGKGIHWPDLDEDISVENLLQGRPSGESHKSLQRWLKSRNAQGV